MWFRDQKDTEVGAMAVTDQNDPMLVRNFVFLPQECTSVTTEFDHDKQCDWMEDQAEAGLVPDMYARVWAHTHPGASANPSSTDWTTFDETMGQMPWGVMLILGTSNEFACVFRVKDQMVNIPVEVLPKGVPDAWITELQNISKPVSKHSGTLYSTQGKWDWTDDGYKRFGRKIRIPDWDMPKGYPYFAKFKDAATELTDFSYTNINKWNPSIEEIMTTGPCKVMQLIIEMYRNVGDSTDELRVKHVIEKVTALFSDNADHITDYDIDNAQYGDAVALLYQARESGQKLKDYVETIDPQVSQYLIYSKKEKEIFLNEYDKAIPEMLSSSEEHTREDALNSCITAALHYEDYCELIDDGCRKFIQQFIDHQAEYNQCQSDHEKTVI